MKTKDAIKLVKPKTEHKEQVLAFRDAFLQEEEHLAGCADLEVISSYEGWLEHITRDHIEETCEKNKVPASLFLGIREKDQTLVGIIQLRHHINHPILLTWGGHVGYSVLPGERNKGYAKEMLRLVLAEARKIGMDKLLVTCQKENIASEKTIFFNGGVFEKEVDYEGTMYKRFWIEL